MDEAIINNLSFQPFTEDIEIKTGHVLRLKDGSTHLVGDVNQLLGFCDDCTEFRKDDIADIAYLFEKEI